MIITGNSIAECWLKMLNKIVSCSGKEISPLMIKINITDERPEYEQELEKDINEFLGGLKPKQPEINTTAGTIFPISLSGGKTSVFERYSRIKKPLLNDRRNKKGTYFHRLMAYGGTYKAPVNQLQHIIDTYNSGIHRRSALIATIFDPTLDHKATPLLGFPCLQQVCFTPNAKNKELSLNAIYAMQYIDIRAYGNYLGLVNLGMFMAKEMNLKFCQLNCMLSVAALGKMTKAEVRGLVDKYSDRVEF